MKDDYKTVTVFKKFSDGEVIALFPFEPEGLGECLSYMHIGQHGVASTFNPSLARALPDEYSDLKEELKSIGYDLDIKQRMPSHRSIVRNTTEE